MTLAVSLQKAVNGQGRFEVYTPTGRILPKRKIDFSQHKGRYVLWPLGNDGDEVWLLLNALVEGVVPVILPQKLPPKKYKMLRSSYPGFGEFVNNEIHYQSTPVQAVPHVFLVLMTSGSTGEPKLVATSEINLALGIRAINAAQKLTYMASTGILLPLAYSYSLVNQLFWAILFERRVVINDGLISPVDTFSLFKEYDIDILCMVAPQIRTLLSLGFGEEEALTSIKVLNFAGAPFPVSDYPGIRELFPVATFYNNYGCTEAMPRLTVCPVISSKHKITCAGKPIGDIKLRITGDEEVGPIEFKGSSTSLGYITADGNLIEHDSWIPSGDLGYIEDGQLHVLGRYDQITKVGGERISLIEIEKTLLVSGINNALAWTEKNDDRSESIMAIINSDSIPDTKQISYILREHLPRNAWPKKIFWTEKWILSQNGKTDRLTLKEFSRSNLLTQVWAQGKQT